MKINKRLGLRFCAFLFLFCAIPWLAEAQAQTFSLSVWPPLLEIIIQPGRSISQPYKLSNSGDDQIIVAKVLPFEPADSEGNINLLPLPNLLNPLVFSFANDQIILGQPFLIKAGENKDLILKISVPKNTSERDYFASLVFETNPEEKTGLAQTQTTAKIATNILLTVSYSGNPAKKAVISEFSCPKIVDSFAKVPFTLKIENTGQAFFKPIGKIKIEGIFNQKGAITVSPDNVLPQFSRQIIVPPWQEKFILGPFKANLELTLNEEGEKLLGQTTFLAIPYKAFLALLVILFILVNLKNLPKKFR